MERIVLLGGGGHCRSVVDSIMRIGCFEDVVITDYNEPKGTWIYNYRVVGNDDILPELYDKGYRKAFITVGSTKYSAIRRNIYVKAISIGYEFPIIVDPSADVSGDATILQGVYVAKKSVVNSGSKVESFAIINTGSIIDHDCFIGEFSHVSVGAVVCGGCRIANDVFIGANATIIQGISVGSNSAIGAGSVVLADVPDNTTVVGVWKGVSKS